MKRISILFLLCLTFLWPAYANEVTKIVVTVNGEVITSKDIDDFCKVLARRFSQEQDSPFTNNERFRAEAVEKLIEDRLILDKAKSDQLQIPDYWVQEKFDEIMLTYPSREAFDESLLERGLTVTILKKRIRDQLRMREVVNKYVRSKVTVMPQEIGRYYQRHPDEFVSPPGYSIWIAQSEDIKTVQHMAELTKDGGIAAATQRYGDTLMKIDAVQNELREELEQVLASLEEGEYAVRVIEGVGYFVYLERRHPQVALPFSEVRDQVHSYLWNQRFQKKLTAWLDELKEQALIKTYQ